MRKHTLLWFFLIIFLVPADATELTTTQEVVFKNVLQGGYAELQIQILTDSPLVLPADISAAGPIENWLNFESPTGFFLSKDRPLELKISVQPPAGTPVGAYVGYIVISIPEEGNKITTSSFSNVVETIKVVVEVTDNKIKDLDVKQIKMENAVEGYPLLFKISLENKGNIEVTPKIQIKISDRTKENIVITSEFSDQTILATQSKTFELQIPSDELQPGKYTAQMFVFLDEMLVKQVDIPFILAEKGTTVVAGKLISIQADNQTYVDSAAYLTAIFENIGMLTFTAKLNADIYLGDEKILTITSSEKTISPGEDAELTAYFIPEQPGTYTAKIKIVYGEFESESKEAQIKVSRREVPLGFGFLPILFIALAAIVLWHFIKFPIKGKKKFHFRKRRKG